MPSKSHPSRSLPFSSRAEDPSAPALTAYLLSLISIKRSNLCVSADIHTTYELLSLAEEVGDYICVLKTHADIIDDFSEKTIRGLQEISRRKHFLLFEDRKLGDIGNTVQSQYTRGPLAIATWAHLTNAHLLPGPSIIPSLASAAQKTLTSLNQSVATIITTGSPRVSLDTNPDESCVATTTSITEPSSEAASSNLDTPEPIFEHTRRRGRPGSFATATTTISQTYEDAKPRKPASLKQTLSMGEAGPQDKTSALFELGAPPHERGLLLLAEMSSEGNLLTPEYTKACVAAGRENKDFVLGFISQKSLNQEVDDAFLNFAPGVNLPAEGETKGVASDGKGQQWRGPDEVIGRDGIDIVIVGRGILGAIDRASEAERYRKASWKAYERRVGR